MLLDLTRTQFTETSTIGRLAVNGVFECYTLEDVVHEPFIKIPGQTAIPAGKYYLAINWSTRFGRMMPLVCAVPEFKGVRIHPGNTDKDTEGCILVGTHVNAKGKLELSKLAFDRLYEKLDRAYFRNEALILQIENHREADPIPPTEGHA